MEYGKILNVEYHRGLLLIESLNRMKFVKDSAELLGISLRTTFEWMHKFDVQFDVSTDKYFLPASFYKFYES